VVRAVLLVGLSLLLAGLAVRAAHPLVWFMNASVIAALSWPVVQRMRRHMPAWAAVVLLTVAVLGALAGLAAVGFSELQSEAGRFERSVPRAAQQLEDEAPLGGLLADIDLAKQVGDLGTSFSERFRLGADLPGLASRLGGAVSSGFLVWILAVMLLFTGPKMVEAAVGSLGPRRAGRLDPALHQAYGRVLRYFALTAARSVVVGTVAFAAASFLDVDLPALLAVVAALLAFVPYVGVVAGLLPLALLSILNGSSEAVAVLAVAVLLQLVDSLVLQERINRASFRFGLFPTLVSAVVGFSLHGVIGVVVGLFVGALAIALLEALGEEPAAVDDTARGDGRAGAGELSGGPEPVAAT
jgi:predicted PurR-regulated permease PerM